MSLMGKLGWVVSLILAAIVLFGGWTFIYSGSVLPASDGRMAVQLLPGERDKVLGEMRGLLETTQAIIEAAVENDMAAIEQAARAAGMAAAEGESPAMMGKLPLEFKTLGLATHRAFDDLADLAATGPAPMDLLAALGETLLNCTACHAAYQLTAVDAAK